MKCYSDKLFCQNYCNKYMLDLAAALQILVSNKYNTGTKRFY